MLLDIIIAGTLIAISYQVGQYFGFHDAEKIFRSTRK
jgi:hypothetical protein